MANEPYAIYDGTDLVHLNQCLFRTENWSSGRMRVASFLKKRAEAIMSANVNGKYSTWFSERLIHQLIITTANKFNIISVLYLIQKFLPCKASNFRYEYSSDASWSWSTGFRWILRMMRWSRSIHKGCMQLSVSFKKVCNVPYLVTTVFNFWLIDSSLFVVRLRKCW